MKTQLERLDMMVSPAWKQAVEDWRAAQRPILNRSEAIRVLVMKGLAAEQEITKPPKTSVPVTD
jgi:hypothetical protein